MPVPGRKCPSCLSKRETVWVIPGKSCPACGTHVSTGSVPSIEQQDHSTQPVLESKSMLAASNQPEDLEGDYDSSDELPVPIAIDLNSFEPSREGKDAGEWNVERFRVAQNCTKKDNEEEKDTESIFSQGSFASSATYYFEDITAAVDEFASLLSHDPVLEPVFATVFRGDSSSAETSMLFTNKLHLVLREYSRVLKFQAAGSLERTSAKLVGLHSRRIANYIREEFEASDTAQDYVRDVLTQNDTQHIRSVWLGNSSESEEDEDDFQPPEYEREPNLHPFSLSQVKDYLISGNHYQTLRDEIQRFASAATGTHACDDITKELERYLDNQTAYSVVFDTYWNLPLFVKEEFLEAPQDLGSVLTATAMGDNAFVATCSQYIQEVFPTVGGLILDTLNRALEVGSTSQRLFRVLPPDGASEEEVEVILQLDCILATTGGGLEESHLMQISAKGATPALVQTVQALSWLVSVLRKPLTGSMAYSRPMYRIRKLYSNKIHVELEPSELVPFKGSNAHCWPPLLRNSVVGQGFPVPARDHGRGLEISFEIMVLLGRIWYPMEYLDGIVLKGRSTVLVPISKVGNAVQWHFIFSERRIGMEEISKHCDSILENADIETLRTCRAFVGFCENACIHAGTHGSGYRDIGLSGASLEPTRKLLARELAPSAGTSGCGFFGVQVGAKVAFTKGLYGTIMAEHTFLEDAILEAKTHPCLLFDTATRRGWLLPELNVMLMIAHVWATKQHDQDALLEKLPFSEPTKDSNNAIYTSLLQTPDKELRKASCVGEGLTMMTLLKTIVAALSSRKEKVIERTASTASLLMTQKNTLMGWELLDIALSKYLFRRKTFEVNKSTSGLWTFILDDNPDVAVIFCHGAGNLIQPSAHNIICDTWSPIPSNRDLLTTTGQMILSISEVFGGSPHAPTLAPQLYLNNPYGRDVFQPCHYQRKSECDRVLDLVEKTPKSRVLLQETDAVILGSSENNADLRRTCRKTHFKRRHDFAFPEYVSKEISTIVRFQELTIQQDEHGSMEEIGKRSRHDHEKSI